jgi:hypothetical protein
MPKDIQSRTETALALAPQPLTATATGPALLANGAAAMTVDVFAGAVTTASGAAFFELELLHGSQEDLSDAVPVPAGELVVDGTPGAALPRLDDAALAGQRITRIGYHGLRPVRALRLAATGAPSAFVCAVAVFGCLKDAPPTL